MAAIKNFEMCQSPVFTQINSLKRKSDLLTSSTRPTDNSDSKRRKIDSDSPPELKSSALDAIEDIKNKVPIDAGNCRNQLISPIKNCSDTSNHNNNPPSKSKKSDKLQQVFQFGNYKRYYGYRNPLHNKDERLTLMKKEWFSGKEILDVGCNTGHITLAIAKDFCPERIVGVDIDRDLITVAKKNVKHYIEECRERTGVYENLNKKIYFAQGNYVPDCDAALDLVTEEFDVILALSITKWLHLNFGDAGLKRALQKMYRQLRPGGLLIIEPQEWSTYKKRKKLTDDIFKVFQSIKFFPENFIDYLKSDEVGFAEVWSLGVSDNKSKGFQRPIHVLRKGGATGSGSTE